MLACNMSRFRLVFSGSFWATVCKTVQAMLSDRCPVLSVCDIGLLWPNGWMKMKLGMQVGLGPGHIVLDGDPARPMSVVAKWMHGLRCHLVWR